MSTTTEVNWGIEAEEMEEVRLPSRAARVLLQIILEARAAQHGEQTAEAA